MTAAHSKSYEVVDIYVARLIIRLTGVDRDRELGSLAWVVRNEWGKVPKGDEELSKEEQAGIAAMIRTAEKLAPEFSTRYTRILDSRSRWEKINQDVSKAAVAREHFENSIKTAFYDVVNHSIFS